jgi:hypothetical protein
MKKFFELNIHYRHIECTLIDLCFFFVVFCEECFMAGLDTGYRIYNTDPLKENAREGTNKINKFKRISNKLERIINIIIIDQMIFVLIYLNNF